MIASSSFSFLTRRSPVAKRGSSINSSRPIVGVEVLARAERLHQQMFAPVRAHSAHPVWTPPVDVLETEREVLIIAALPGVSEDAVSLVLDGGCLIIAGELIDRG